MNLDAYLRVSTLGQIDGYGLAAQTTDIKRRARRDGHRIRGFFEEQGISGTLDETGRPVLFARLKAIKARETDGLIVANLGRFARELYIQEAVLAKIWDMGGRVFSADVGEVLRDDPDDPMRTAMRQMAGVFYQLDRAMINKRLRNGRAEKARQGGYAYGSPRYGVAAVDHELVELAAEQAGIARIESLRDQGLSSREIAETLNSEGIPSKRGGPWHSQTVLRVLARMGE